MGSPSVATVDNQLHHLRVHELRGREIWSRVQGLVLVVALCHKVTPSTENVDGGTVTMY